jgi:hypothetical protein
MTKILAAAVCALALVGCGGPIDENDPNGAEQQFLVQPDGLPTGTAQLDQTQLNLDQQAAVQARNAQFADNHVWGVTERPSGCHK